MRMILPIDVSVAMILVTALIGQVLSERVSRAIQSLALSISVCLVVSLGWRDWREGTAGIGDVVMLLSCGETLQIWNFCGW